MSEDTTPYETRRKVPRRLYRNIERAAETAFEAWQRFERENRFGLRDSMPDYLAEALDAIEGELAETEDFRWKRRLGAPSTEARQETIEAVCADCGHMTTGFPDGECGCHCRNPFHGGARPSASTAVHAHTGGFSADCADCRTPEPVDPIPVEPEPVMEERCSFEMGDGSACGTLPDHARHVHGAEEGDHPPAPSCHPYKPAWAEASRTPVETAGPERVARMFHEAYERLAPEYGYETRKESAVPWADVPENNRRLMTATVRAITDELVREVERQVFAPQPVPPSPEAAESRITTLERDRERMETALRPFAEYADLNDIEDDGPDDAIEVPTRDLAAARRALTGSQEDGNG